MISQNKHPPENLGDSYAALEEFLCRFYESVCYWLERIGVEYIDKPFEEAILQQLRELQQYYLRNGFHILLNKSWERRRIKGIKTTNHQKLNIDIFTWSAGGFFHGCDAADTFL